MSPGPLPRFCGRCGNTLRPGRFCGYCGAPVTVLWQPPPSPPPAPRQPDLRVEYPERQSRVTALFRLVLAIPHLVALSAVGLAVALLMPVSWASTAITRRNPAWLRRFSAWYLRWATHVQGYTVCLRDEYPPFGAKPYPIEVMLSPPERSNWWTALVRVVLAIPAAAGLLAVGLAACWTLPMAWFGIVFGGRQPEGLWRFHLGVLTWQTRLLAYVLLLTDVSPPFSVGAERWHMDAEPVRAIPVPAYHFANFMAE